MRPELSLENLLKRDRALVLAALAGVCLPLWAVMFREARASLASGVCQCLGASLGGPGGKTWGTVEFILVFAMWVEMMAAMMIPAIAPVILTFAALNRKRRAEQRPFVPAGFFLLGYLAVWAGFSLGATLLQWWLHSSALLSPAWATGNAMAGGAILIAAGVFQATSWKKSCLAHCRSPLDFFLAHWSEGCRGAFGMGWRHGSYCLGCCWILMGLLFVVGVMNLYWISILTLFVLIEKTAPHHRFWVNSAALLLVAWGSWVLGHLFQQG